MGHRNSSAEMHNQSKLDALRDDGAQDMDNYFLKLDLIGLGDSVVRRFTFTYVRNGWRGLEPHPTDFRFFDETTIITIAY